ncbi:MAG: chalcone isomerase family protein [Opitutales bacterium]
MIKTHKLLTLLLLAILLPRTDAAAEALFPQEITLAEESFQKLGEYRYVYRFFFELYEAALYAPADATAEEVLEAATPYRLQFRYLRTIDKGIILKSADRMLEKNLSSEERDQIAERIDRINAAYTTVNKGDTSSLTYQPDSGTTLKVNGEPKITIEGEDFAQLYFRIWLGPQPISKSLKANLLGRD